MRSNVVAYALVRTFYLFYHSLNLSNYMKQIKFYLLALLTIGTLAACSSDNDGDSNGGGNSSANVNKNIVTYDQAVKRLEFPKLHGGNSIFIIYRDANGTNGTKYDPDAINYSVEWDCEKKSQRWSCYILTNKNRSGKTSNLREYPNDPSLTSSQRWDKDYYYGSSYGTGAHPYDTSFDHGHICPHQDRQYSSNATYQTYYLTNMQPQYKVFNGSHPDHKYKGLWIKMENYLNGFKLNDTDTMYVCKGGTIDKEEHILTRIQGKLIVPKYFFVAVLVKKMVKGQAYYKSIGMWFPHINVYHGDDKLSDYAMSIKDLEAKTGIDFFCNLPDDIERDVESKKILSDWNNIETYQYK